MATTYQHQPTPTPIRPPTESSRAETLSVSCSKCRPSSRDKITVVPLDTNGAKKRFPLPGSTPDSILRSLFNSLARRTPLRVESTPPDAQTNGEWKLAAADLSRKLVHVTRHRDELKRSIAGLERKLTNVESHCRELRAALDPPSAAAVIEPFVLAASEARAAVRHLSRCLISQLRASPRSTDRIGSILRSDGFRGGLVVGLEAVLNRVFYSDFERGVEGEGMIPDPAERCRVNRAGYEVVRGLGWDDVLSKGTRHYSEGLSKFCDRRMSEVVGILGWARAWPEGLLQAFFGAARGVWVVYLLARSVHPGLPIMRVDRGARFDPVYMEEMSAVKVSKGSVVIMVAPGFYLHGATCSVVKCRVMLMGVGETSGRSCDGKEKEKGKVEVVET